MNLGKLDRLITLQAPGAPTQNAYGETAPAVFIDAASVYAQVDYPQGAEATEAAQLQTVQPVKFRIRYRAGVETSWRVRYEDHTYQLTAVAEMGRRVGLILTAVRRGQEPPV